ncbi:trypco2 family protein [Streptomyces sp. NPDC005955]|uniref:trypco2 family protein n=1 Tax=Streptomyces sp. NPDC005955 TaxID=3364738 RepID=UPI0036C88C20
MEIGLAEAVAAVREELRRAAEQGADEGLKFGVGPVQMEFEVELRADARAKGGFRVWAVSAETEAGVVRGRTHRVSFTLTPCLEGAQHGVLIAAGQDSPFGAGDVSGTVE